MYILDSILKNVQGYYVSLFQARMPQLFLLAFQNAASDSQRRALIKLLNVWKMFLNPELIQTLYYQLNLQEYVSTKISLLMAALTNLLGVPADAGGGPTENCPLQERVLPVLPSRGDFNERELQNRFRCILKEAIA